MSNAFSVMTNVLRNAVSKQRIRYIEKGFNLDLAYITPKIIAMGFPADKLESIYRNRFEDVLKFLEESHHNHYKIYNLCSERSYDKNKFHGRVAEYPFEDHNPPTIELIQRFCHDVDTWLSADDTNVAAVHCKAGKGRTGTMICCYLVYCRQYSTAEDALAYYDEKRTKDRKGVTIPSQRRYVMYFSKLIQSNKLYEKRTLQFCELRFSEAYVLHNQMVNCSISVLEDTSCATPYNVCIDFRKSSIVDLRNVGLEVTGDVKVELISKQRKKGFHFFFNTYFISDESVIEGEGDDACYVYTLKKNEIDDAHKDKEHKCYGENFKVQLVFFVNNSRERTNCASTSGKRVSNSNNHHDSAMNMGTTRIFANTNTNTQGHPNPAQQMSGELSYHCDHRSSSSSASVSSLAGGVASGVSGLGTQISGNNDLMNSTTTTTDRFKRNSNGNATSANADVKSQHPLTNKWRTGVFYNREAGAETLMDYNYSATANNVTTAKLKEQQQYQPSENNVNIVPPSKVSRGSNHNSPKVETSNELSAINAYGKTAAAGITAAKNATTTLSPNNICANKNGIHHWKNDNNEHDASCGLEQYEDDDDVGEDWESGESSAKSLSHIATGNLTQTTETTKTTKTKTTFQNKSSQSPQTQTQTQSQSQPQSQSLSYSTIHNHPPTTSSLLPSNLLTTARPTTNADKQYDDKSSSNLHKLMMGYTSVNLVDTDTELTNTSVSCSSRSNYSSKAYIGGDNNGNDSSVSTSTSASASACASSSSSYASFKNVVNNDLYEKYIVDDIVNNDDDNGNNRSKQNQQLPQQQQQQQQENDEQKVQSMLKVKSNVNNEATSAIATSSASRMKFFSFTNSKATNLAAVANERTTNNSGVVAVVSPPKQPFFRRKSFKSAANNATSADCKEGAEIAADANTCSSSSGLADLSKLKLKIKLKKNRFKLAQKLQKFQNYLRSDPNEFCENFVQQTVVKRRNSNCSVGSRSHKTIAQSTPATPASSTNLSVSPKFILNELSTPPLASNEPNSLDNFSMDIDGVLQLILPAAAMHSSSSATASNASLGSSSGCDASCGGSGNGGGANVAFSGDDYYSSICDNQLSFNNSPCKSPRSLIDISLMSGGGESASSLGSAPTLLRHTHHHQFHHQANHSHHQQQHHYMQHSPLLQQHNYQRSPFHLSKSKANCARSNIPMPKHQEQPEQLQKNDVVVVAAKPAKTYGFNVNTASNTNMLQMQENNDCTDGSVTESPTTKIPLNGFASTPQSRNSSDMGTPSERSSIYFTPPSSSVSNENDVFDSNNIAQQSNSFVFPEMSAEISNVIPGTAAATAPNTSLRQRENWNLTLQLKMTSFNSKAKNQLNKSKTPSTDEASLESIDNGNSSNTAGTTTGTSSSGFSNSDCCCCSGNNGANGNDKNVTIDICHCNPFAIHLERYAADAAKKNDIQSSRQTISIDGDSIVEESTATDSGVVVVTSLENSTIKTVKSE